MHTYKKTVLSVFSFLMLVLLSSGCKLFDSAKQRLHTYCPGIKVALNGVSYSTHGARDVYVLSYDHDSQQSVKAYFEKPENGFHEIKDGGFYDIEMDNNNIIDRSDNIIGKTVKTAKDSTEVIFNESTRKIIFIEHTK